MKKLFTISAIAFALVMGITTIAQAQNLVVNGDLESWSAGVPDGWAKAENIEQEATNVHGGSSSAKQISDETTKDLQQDIVGILAGTEYEISYWFLDNDTEARSRIWAYWLSAGATLPDNEDILRPGDYSEDNADWQQFSTTLTAPAGADGFRFEVRAYKQDNVWGGAVYYDDFNFTGDVIVDPEPTNYPTDFSALISGPGISLEWTDAIGAQLPSTYVIVAGTSSSLPVPADGTPIASDNDLSDGSGALNIDFGVEMGSFSNLTPNTTYYFAIYPYTNAGVNIDFKNDGTAPADEVTTSNNTTVEIEYENFDLSWGSWTTVSVVGDQVWDRDNTFGIDGTACAKMSGFDGSAFDNEDWLISPAMNFTDYENESMNFFSAMNYTGPDLELKISTDYSGSGNPNDATWNDLSFMMPPGGSWDFVESGNVSLSAYDGTAVYVGFKFTCTTVGSATWELDDITITGEGEATTDPEPSEYPTSFAANATGTSINVSWTDAIGEQLPAAYIVYAGTNSSLPMPTDGTPVTDDIDLSDGSAAVNVVFGSESISFNGLPANTTYHFTIYPYTNSGTLIDYKTDGTAPADDATTVQAQVVVIESENFDNSWGNWTTVSVVGTQAWDRDNTWGVDDTPCASMTGYDGAPYTNDDWLISPALNLNDYANETLVFKNALGYTGPDLQCKVSTDYDGGTDPGLSTWTLEEFTMSAGFFEWTESGSISLSGYNGSAVYVAFQFTSTDSESATWEIDDIVISGEEDAGIGDGFASDLFKIYPNPSNGMIYIDNFNNEISNINVLSVTGSMVAEFVVQNPTQKIDLSHLEQGLYLIQAINTNGQSSTQKLMLK